MTDDEVINRALTCTHDGGMIVQSGQDGHGPAWCPRCGTILRPFKPHKVRHEGQVA